MNNNLSKKSFNLLVLIMFTLSVKLMFSQTNDSTTFLFLGVIHNEKDTPIPNVFVYTKNKKSTISNGSGKFDIQVSLGDTLYISHVAYEKSYFSINSLLKKRLEIELLKKTNSLSEHKVIYRPNYKEFKTSFINLSIDNKELLNAKNNMNLILNQSHSTLNVGYTHEDYQKQSIQNQINLARYRGQVAPQNMIDFKKIFKGVYKVAAKKK